MALATRCPACSTVFRISTAQAAAKGGMVRCGHCQHVFNSLDALVRVEDLEILDESLVTAAASDAPDVAPAPLALSAHDEFIQSEVSSLLADLSTPTDPGAKIDEWWLPAPRPVGKNARVPRTDAATADSDRRPAPGAAPALTAPPRDAPLLGDDPSWSGSSGATGAVFMQRPWLPEPARTPATWTWGFLGLFAFLVLVGQCVYLWRDEIAVRWSPARPWLVTACNVLDCLVDYPARPEAVTIESANVQTAAAAAGTGPGAGLYVLNALLRNRDTTDVRYPHLELTLTDTNDHVVLRRVLRPQDYLALRRDGGERIGPSFAPQSELSVHLTFELTNLRFAGYRLDHFYP